MGLDMYLHAKKYIGCWEHSKPEEKKQLKAVLKIAGLKNEDIASGSPGVYIEVTVGYWYDANQIHRWFVDETQEGSNQCQQSHVSREQLKELYDLCQRVRIDPKKGEDLLPTRSGFFFGATGYDEDYMQDLEDTIKIIAPLLAKDGKFEHWAFYYQASW